MLEREREREREREISLGFLALYSTWSRAICSAVRRSYVSASTLAPDATYCSARRERDRLSEEGGGEGKRRGEGEVSVHVHRVEGGEGGEVARESQPLKSTPRHAVSGKATSKLATRRWPLWLAWLVVYVHLQL
jgi:hypothetical protein